MSYQSIIFTGKIIDTQVNPDGSPALTVQCRRVIALKEGIRENLTDFLCYFNENTAKLVARLSVDNHISVIGQLIPDEKGNPGVIDGISYYQIDVSSITLLNDQADEAREDLQRVILVGFPGKEPELRYTESGSMVCNSSIAAEYLYKDAEGKWQKDTIWTRISLWGTKAESFNQHIHKPFPPIIIEINDLTVNEETNGPRMFDRRDGSLGSSFEASVNSWRFSPTRKENGGGKPAGNEPADDSDDIPF
jgi:single-strand DNA-binding protein